MIEARSRRFHRQVSEPSTAVTRRQITRSSSVTAAPKNVTQHIETQADASPGPVR